MQDSFEDDLDPVSMSAILRPLGNCAELLNPTAVCPMLTKCVDRAVTYVTALQDKDLKNKVNFSNNATLESFVFHRLNGKQLIGYRVCPGITCCTEVVVQVLVASSC